MVSQQYLKSLNAGFPIVSLDAIKQLHPLKGAGIICILLVARLGLGNARGCKRTASGLAAA